MVVGKHVDSIGIADQRTLGAPQLGDNGNSRLLAGAQSRPDANGLEIIGFNGFLEGGLLAVYLQNSLWDSCLHNGYVLTGRMARHLAGT